MIPLRILHAVPSPDSPEAQAARPALDALAAQGHEGAWLCPGTHPEHAEDGRTVIGFATGQWRWWRSERTATVRRVAAWTPDLLHVHALDQLATSIDIGRRLGLSLVASVHQTEEPYAARRLRDPLVAWVLVPSEHHRAHALGRIGVARDRVAILPAGVDIAPPPSSSPTANAWTVGTVAGDDLDGLRRLLRAVAEVQEAGLQLQARVLTAEPEQQERIAELARDARAEADVQVGEDLEEFIAGIDVLALPDDGESSTVAVLTAMAHGKPLLALATGGLPELARDGRTAVLVEPDDDDGLANGLRQLHERTFRSTLGEAARNLAQERYCAGPVAETLLAVYRAALGDAGSGAKAEITTAWRRMTGSRSR